MNNAFIDSLRGEEGVTKIAPDPKPRRYFSKHTHVQQKKDDRERFGADFYRALERDINGQPDVTALTLDRHDIDRLTRILTKLRNAGEISDQDLSKLLGIVTAAFVEQHLAHQFDRVMDRSFERVFMGRRF